MRVKQWHKTFDGVRHDLQPVYYRKKRTFLRIEDIWYCEECDKMVDMQYQAMGTGRKILMSKGYTSMSERLHSIESKRERRGVDRSHSAGCLGSVVAAAPGARLSSEVDLEPLASDVMASLPVAGPNPTGPVAAAVPVARFTSEVEPMATELVSSSSKEKSAGWPGDRYPGTPRGAPCPCGSGEKYKRCHGKGAPPKEL